MGDTLRVAKLDDMQDAERITPSSIFKTKTAGDALAVLKSNGVTRVAVMVRWSRAHSSYLQIPKEIVIANLEKHHRSFPIICDLDRDGWCWIGEAG